MTVTIDDIYEQLAQDRAEMGREARRKLIDPDEHDLYVRALDDATVAREAAGFPEPIPPAQAIRSLTVARDDALNRITELLKEREALIAALEPLRQIAVRYERSDLDEHRPSWPHREPRAVDMVVSRGGGTIVTLQHALDAKALLDAPPRLVNPVQRAAKPSPKPAPATGVTRRRLEID